MKHEWLLVCLFNWTVPQNIHIHPTPHPTPQKGLEFLGGWWGSLRPKNVRKCKKFNWNFQKGGVGVESQRKKIPPVGGGVDIFWNYTLSPHYTQWKNCGRDLNPGPCIIGGLGLLLFLFLIKEIFFSFSTFRLITEKQRVTLLHGVSAVLRADSSNSIWIKWMNSHSMEEPL